VGIIPAAGRGRRIRDYPLSKVLPKPLFPIGDICLIESSIRLFQQVGIENVLVVVNHKANLIKEFLGDGREWDINIKYIYQERLNGIAGAVALCEPEVGGNFVVSLGDEVTKVDGTIFPMLEMRDRLDAMIVEATVGEWDYRVIKETNEIVFDSNGFIMDIREKPEKPRSLKRGIGLYACRHDVFDLINKVTPSQIRGEVEITDVVKMAAEKGSAYAWSLPGYTLNINTLENLKEADRTMLGWIRPC